MGENISSQKIAFLGCGSMAEAIMAGLIGSGFDRANICATTKTRKSSDRLAEKYGIETAATNGSDGVGADRGEPVNAEVAARSDIVLLGVKPKDVKALAQEIAPGLRAGTIVISIAAAVSIKLLEDALPKGQPVIRSMPNTPLMVGRGVVGVSPGTCCDENILNLAQQVFSNSGTVVVIPEGQQDIISAVSGSGPAYAFYFTEALSYAAQDLGMAQNVADIIAQDTVAGAGAMLDQPGAVPQKLRKAVTSPNGTTEQAIAVFGREGLFDMVRDAAKASMRRAAEMRAEIEKKP